MPAAPIGRYSAKQVESGISVPEHDYIQMTNNASGNPTQVVYRNGGPSGTIVATVTMNYDGNGYLTSVSKLQ